MALSDLLKKNRVLCPHCQNGFELGADLEAISQTAGDLLDKLGGFLSGVEDEPEEVDSKVHPWILHIAGEFDVPPSEAQGLLEAALEDQAVLDAICDFLESEE